MKYLPVLNNETAGAEAKELFVQLKKKLGRVPNIYAAMANSPQALLALLAFKDALHNGVLNTKEEEAIALAVGQVNNCGYCMAAHTAMAKMAGFSVEEAGMLRQAKHDDKKLDALVKLAKEITVTQGNPDGNVLKNFFDAGYDNAALSEVIAHVSANIFTNYFNHIADPEIDFPIPE